MTRREAKHEPRRRRGEAAASVGCTDPVPELVSVSMVFVRTNLYSAHKFPGKSLDDGERTPTPL